MPSNIGTGYVQIVPTAKGIQGSIEKALNGEANSAGSKLGGTLAGKIKTAIAGAGIGVAIGKSISEGAKLEQSLGGVETLFKDHANQVVANADKAWKTAGISANDYMENVTSFSASLLQSLGGDTQKAVKYADTAIIDMADNSAKFGSNLQDIQHAYQGFAKQNYTMLD